MHVRGIGQRVLEVDVIGKVQKYRRDQQLKYLHLEYQFHFQ